jgi:hypothetical protein
MRYVDLKLPHQILKCWCLVFEFVFANVLTGKEGDGVAFVWYRCRLAKICWMRKRAKCGGRARNSLAIKPWGNSWDAMKKQKLCPNSRGYV